MLLLMFASSPPKFEDALLRLLRKHQSDIDELSFHNRSSRQKDMISRHLDGQHAIEHKGGPSGLSSELPVSVFGQCRAADELSSEPPADVAPVELKLENATQN